MYAKEDNKSSARAIQSAGNNRVGSLIERGWAKRSREAKVELPLCSMDLLIRVVPRLLCRLDPSDETHC